MSYQHVYSRHKYTYTFTVIWVRWNYFVCRWYRKNDKRTNGLKKKRTEKSVNIGMHQRFHAMARAMFISIFTAACKLLFDNIFTWVSACVRACARACVSAPFVSTLNYADRIKIYTHHLSFSRHICTYACLLVSYFFSLLLVVVLQSRIDCIMRVNSAWKVLFCHERYRYSKKAQSGSIKNMLLFYWTHIKNVR